MKGGDLAPIIVDGTKEMLGTDAKGRTQRQTIALKDVRYRITRTLSLGRFSRKIIRS